MGAGHSMWSALRLLITEVRSGLRGKHVALVAAGTAFFSLISLVALMLVLLRLCGWLLGVDGTRGAVSQIGDALPAGHGVQAGVTALAGAAVELSLVAFALALLPASLYGEGLRRSFLHLSPVAVQDDTFTGWRGRLGMVPAVVAAPFVMSTALLAAPWLAGLANAGGWRLVLSAVVAFHLLWVLLSTEVLLVFRFVGVGVAGWRATVVSGFVTGAFLCGFLGGFVLFLAVPFDWSAPFGGLAAPGATVAVSLWLYLLHAVLLVGYQLMLCLDGRAGRLLAPAGESCTGLAPGGRVPGRHRGGWPWRADVASRVRLRLRHDRRAGSAKPQFSDDTDGLARWARLHQGHDPSGSVLASAWVVLAQRCARTRLLRAVPPDLLSLGGPLAAAAAVGLAFGGGLWPVASCALVVLSGLLDGLDGAVAVTTGRARPLGAVVDATADRIADLLLVAVLYALGAPASWCVAAATVALLHEYLRARAVAAGMRGVGALSVAERPLRVVLCAVACLGSGLLPAGTPGTGWPWADVCVLVWVAAGGVGLVQLAVGVARALR
ncbi:YhjD/YihY/BrkB family envelope integrity protein [Streptomyces sp. NPDC056296]|uniref:YhjD/YihY/BrkB family envelope integrity protein n=1 Tax=Streptomyces sp. NPDC056296 TaxID=3345775 RepID=UPI0035DC221A